MLPLASELNRGAVATGLAVDAYAFEPGLVVRVAPAVGTVLDFGRVPKVSPAVVLAVGVAVIDAIIGPAPRHVEAREPMREERPIEDPDDAIKGPTIGTPSESRPFACIACVPGGADVITLAPNESPGFFGIAQEPTQNRLIKIRLGHPAPPHQGTLTPRGPSFWPSTFSAAARVRGASSFGTW